MKKICEYLREHAIKKKIKNKKMTLLTNEQQEWYENAKIFHICQRKYKLKKKSSIIAIRQGNIAACA